jgi:predicted amidophosphoribosyltransferase
MFMCSICLAELINVAFTSCGHVTCRGCWSRIAADSNLCPVCRFNVAGAVTLQLSPVVQLYRYSTDEPRFAATPFV